MACVSISACHSPPRRGGVAAPRRKCREATETAQTGWSDRHIIDFAELTTPALSRHPSQGSRTISPLFSFGRLPYCYGAGQQGSSGYSSARRGILTAKGVALLAEDETCGDVYYKNEGKQNEAGRPGLLMPIFIGRDGVFKDGVGERGCWLVPAGTPK